MSEKHIVVQGAICKCQFGNCLDSLVVNTHQKEYANDAECSDKLIVTTKEIGSSTLKNNSFGSCTKLGSPSPPCKVNITEWKDFYEPVTLSNGGKVILENSKATCDIAGTPCISITYHGQIAELSAQNFKNVNREIQSQINPMVDLRDMNQSEIFDEGIEEAVK